MKPSSLLKARRMLHIYDRSSVPLPPLWFELQGLQPVAVLVA